ncbi:putative ABC-type transport system involved in lysophospholipase L1 biosynthesis, permease component [Clostridium aceticum]|uniref:Putative ABC-type transport system involved in lysophospholipase L1 biosynthesis, permease component n=1 Tax=Clostridium aceticum TaxID=84022 RepID=A0A0D8IAE3_9CLOT|nr:FtsX-like permease family protein [Clostridium aceticum]AKL96585.1 putative ABC-type transport system involved in lysophospholipase L1 biosynthesis, permease component [Clostridium aceticum]KJF27260.1 hypothetical protein TZ02_07890 [Clostridium aceticum]
MTLFNFAVKNISRDKRNYIYYFVNCVFSVFVFFLFSVLSFHPALSVIDKNSSMALILILGQFISVTFTICFISYSVRGFLKARSKQFGLITIMGASKKQLNKLIFTENMVIGYASIITGILLGLIFSKLFLIVAGKIIGVSDFNFYLPLRAMLLTMFVLGLVFLGIAYFTPKFIRKKEIVQLIKAEVVGEKRPKLLLATLSFAILFTGVVWIFLGKSPLAASLRDNTITLIPLTITVVLGTYLLFAYGLRLLVWANNRTNDKLRLLYGGDMNNKLRTNSQSMTVTAILYAISFFAIIILLSMSSNVRSQTIKIMPYPITYNVRSENVNPTKDLAMIEKELGTLGSYDKLNFSFHNAKDGSIRDSIMPLSKYNEIMQFLGREAISVNKGEVYLVSGNVGQSVQSIPDGLQDFFLENRLHLSIVGNSDETIMLSGYVNSVCVISDDDFNTLEPKLAEREIYAFYYDNWETDSEIPQRIQTALRLDDERNDINVIFAYDYFSSSQLQNNLTLYIGGILCFTFILAVASFVYSRLYSALDVESKKYRSIVKIGLSKKELSKVINNEVSLILLVPFGIALIYLWFGIFVMEHSTIVSTIPTALISTAALVFIQTIFWLGVRAAYKKAFFNKVYDEI